MLRRVYFGLTPKPEDPLKLAILPFLVEVCYEFVAGVWEAGLSVAGDSSRLYRASQGDEVDVHCAQYFVNSSLSLVLLIRRRLKSVADVLKGIPSYHLGVACGFPCHAARLCNVGVVARPAVLVRGLAQHVFSLMCLLRCWLATRCCLSRGIVVPTLP